MPVKRPPRDTNQLAKYILEVTTGETEKIDGFSKKIENHIHAIAIHYMHYNSVRIHQSLRCSPAMAAGVSNTLWSIEDMVNLLDA